MDSNLWGYNTIITSYIIIPPFGVKLVADRLKAA